MQLALARDRRLVLALLLAFAAVLLVKNAWLSDDAYITFRTVENLAAGRGAVYNAGERLQSYTHPLWLLVLSVLRCVTGELYYTTIVFSLLLTLVTLAFVFRSTSPSRVESGVLAVAVLLASKAFVDFSSSGLENPLSHVILALFLGAVFRANRNALAGPALLAGLAGVNRLDTLLLYLPPLVFLVRQAGWRRGVRALAVGFSPLIVWTGFSLLYYGAPVPNTAYAKLATGISGWAFLRQGLLYCLDSLCRDPVTLTAVVVGCALAWTARFSAARYVAGGVVLYFLYILAIGGDFMSGRFFTLPLLAAAVLIAQRAGRLDRTQLAAGCACLCMLTLVSAKSHLVSGRRFGMDVPLVPTKEFGPLPLSLINPHGICDERAFYYRATGLLRPGGGSRVSHQWAELGARLADSGMRVHVLYAVGFAGYYAGPDVHVIDTCGLCDFLLARLPLARGARWRIGHFRRDLPAGYVESLLRDENLLENRSLAAYYEAVRPIPRGRLLDRRRLAAIWRLNTGRYNHFIEEYASSLGR